MPVILNDPQLTQINTNANKMMAKDVSSSNGIASNVSTNSQRKERRHKVKDPEKLENEQCVPIINERKSEDASKQWGELELSGGGAGNGSSRERNNRGVRPSGGGATNNYRKNNGNRYYGYGNNDNFYPNNGNYKQVKQVGGFRGSFGSRDMRSQSGSVKSGAPRDRQRNSDSAEQELGLNRNAATQNPRPDNKTENGYGNSARSYPTQKNTRPKSPV